jgi:hypothetical protein
MKQGLPVGLKDLSPQSLWRPGSLFQYQVGNTLSGQGNTQNSPAATCSHNQHIG